MRGMAHAIIPRFLRSIPGADPFGEAGFRRAGRQAMTFGFTPTPNTGGVAMDRGFSRALLLPFLVLIAFGFTVSCKSAPPAEQPVTLL